MATRVVAKTELRQRIRDELADLGDDTLLVTDRGRPLVVAVSIDRWNELQETVEDLEDRIAVLEHRRGPERGRSAATVLKDIEASSGDIRRPARSAS